MKNFTGNNTGASPNYESELWIISLCINLILIVMSLWMTASIVAYGIISGKFYRNKRTRLSENLLLKLAFIMAILLFPRILTSQALLWIGYNPDPDSDRSCEQLIDASVIVFYVALFPVGLFLWLRQRSLYLQPSLITLYSTPIMILSWGSILFLFFSGIGICLVLTISTDFESSWNGCRNKEGVDRQKVVHNVLTAILVMGELTLLLLFIYPLYRHRQTQPFSNFNSKGKPCNSYADESSIDDVTLQSPVSSPPSSKQQSTKQNCRKSNIRSVRTSKRIYRAMRISVLCASTCILSDLLSFTLITLTLPTNTLRSFRNTLYDINLLINFLSIIFCFENYRRIFMGLGVCVLQRVSTGNEILTRTTTLESSKDSP